MDIGAGYATDLLPCVVVQAVGMGLLFVPLTLTAVSRVDPRDAGVGSAVLNTVQQVGGAIGIAVLGTVFANGISRRAAELTATAGGPPSPAQLEETALEAQAFGTSQAFEVAMWMMVAVTVVILVGLSIRHEDLATDVTPGAPPPQPEIPAQPEPPASGDAARSSARTGAHRAPE
jgi:hypothetical protein